jgi:hypothetical protein
MRDPVLAVDKASVLAYARALPMALDEAQAKFGLRIFDMMQADAAVEAGVRKWKQEVFSGAEFKIVAPPGLEDDVQVKEDVEFLRRCVDDLDFRLEDVGWEILDAGVYGHSLIEPLWARGVGGKWVLSDLRVIPHDMYVLVQDVYGRFLGVIGWIPGRVPLLWEGPLYMALADIPGFIPAWRFALHIHNKRAGSVGGRSRLASVYNPWKLKGRTWILYLKHLVRFSGAIPIGICAADTQAKDAEKTPEQELAELLGSIDESQAIGLPPETQVQFAQVSNGEQPYLKTLDAMNREILLGVLGSSKTVMEAKNDSQAAQATAQDAVDEDTSYTAASLCATLTRRVLRPLVRANRGVGVVCPWLILGSDAGSFVEAAPGIAALYSSGAVCDNQEAEIWKAAGVCAPDVPWSRRGRAA